MFSKIHLKNWTAFDDLTISFSAGINVFIGENGTGKTHVMKALYSACDVIENKEVNFAQKISNVFLPAGKRIGRLVKRGGGSQSGKLEIWRESEGKTALLELPLTNHKESWEDVKVKGMKDWRFGTAKCAFIPVKDMTANAPGFVSLYNSRELHFEEIYNDILLRASIPALQGKKTAVHRQLLNLISQAISGTVIEDNQEFYLKSEEGNLEFTLLAEGMRKLGLLWKLIQNGTLLSGSVLFWDEPESNMNPGLLPLVADILLELQRSGIQIFIAAHDYLLPKYLEIRASSNDNLSFYSLYRDAKNRISCEMCSNFRDLKRNPIICAFDKLLDEVYSSDIQGK